MGYVLEVVKYIFIILVHVGYYLNTNIAVVCSD